MNEGKLEDAERLGIEIMDEAAFLAMLGLPTDTPGRPADGGECCERCSTFRCVNTLCLMASWTGLLWKNSTYRLRCESTRSKPI